MLKVHWSLSPVTGPASEPLNRTEVKNHLRLDITDDDALVDALLTAARQFVENYTSRALITRTLDLVMDEFPSDEDHIDVPRAPLRSVTSITYVDTDDATTTWTASEYIVDTKTTPGRVVLAYAESFPSTILRPANGVTARFVAGHATAFTVDATTNVVTAAGHPYANGDIVRLSNSGGALPAGLAADTDYYVISATTSTLKLSLTSGGTEIDITGAGTGTHYLGEVPRPILQAILLLVGHWYENREQVVVGATSTIATEVPFAVQALLGPYRVWG